MSFSNLLRASRVAKAHGSREQVFTADSSYHYRGYFGFKQPVKGANKFLMAKTFDLSKDLEHDEPVYGMSMAANFVRRWDELQTQINVPSLSSQFVVSKASEDDASVAQAASASPSNWVSTVYNANGIRASKEEPPAKNIFAMNKRQFKRFLRKLTPAERQSFAQFLESQPQLKATRNSSSNMVNSVFPSSAEGALLLSHAQQPAALTHAAMTQFLKKHFPDYQAPRPHQKLGLQYSHPTLLESFFTPRVPGHIVERPVRLSGAAAASSASTKGNASKSAPNKSFSAAPADIARDELGRNMLSTTVSVMSQIAKVDSPLKDVVSISEADPQSMSYSVPSRKDVLSNHATAPFFLRPTLYPRGLASRIASEGRHEPVEYRVITKSSLPSAFRDQTLALNAIEAPQEVPVPGSLKYSNAKPDIVRKKRSRAAANKWERTQFKKWQ